MKFFDTTKKKGDAFKSLDSKAPPFFFAAALLVVSCWSSVAHAQGVSLGAPPAPVQYTVIPEIPGSNTPVTISVAGVGTFIGESPITWTQNGKIVETGIGKNKFSFQTGSLGQTTTVGISIKSTEHGTITNTWVFNPSLINLVWEANTTVPPLYKGKALYSLGSQVTVFAFPEIRQNGSRLSESSLSFQWKLAGQPVVEQSGLGRNRLTFTGSQLRAAETVSVTVLSGGTPVGSADITVTPTVPALILYARDPLRGILYNTALPGTFSMGGQEITVHAEPYYFSRTGAGLTWSWTLNGNPTSGPNTGAGELTLRTQGGGGGSAIVGVSLQNTNPNTFLQAARNSVTLLFGGTERNSIFGL